MSGIGETSGGSRTKWKSCAYCSDTLFKNPQEFVRHLRARHCTQEGGSFVCRYGYNKVCFSLPVEGVSDQDYEAHILRHHLYPQYKDNFAIAKAGEKKAMSQINLIHADQPSVVVDGQKWNIYMAAQNLPAVLNDPNRGKQLDFFTKTWGDYFVNRTDIPQSPYLPEVPPDYFETYLKKTSKRYKKHVRRTASLQSPTQKEDTAQLFPNLKAAKSMDKIQLQLDSIPKIFVQPSFNLSKPEVFMTVFPFSKEALSPTVSSSGVKNIQHSGKLLQEKLTHYLDIVEVQIVQQVAQKSKAFFHAMSSHDHLMGNLTQTLKITRQVRDKVRETDCILVQGPLQIVKLNRVRNNYLSVFNKLKLMATVNQTQPTIQLLLSTSDFVGALDIIATTQEVLSQELAGIQSVRHLGSQLEELEKGIEKMMQAEFVRYAQADLNRPLDDVNPGILEEEKLVAVVFGMLCRRQYSFLETYEEEVKTAIKSVVKKSLCEVDPMNQDGNVNKLTNQVRVLHFDDWLKLFQDTTKNMLVLLKRIKAVQSVISDAMGIAAGKSRESVPVTTAPDTPSMRVSVSMAAEDVMIPLADHKKLSSTLTSLMTMACDLGHERCSRLLMTRARDKHLETLTTSEFVTLSQTVEDIIVECELLCGKRSAAMQLTLQGQASQYVKHFHEEKKTKLSLLLETERWRQADVPAQFQEMVDSVTDEGRLHIPQKPSNTQALDNRRPKEYLVVLGEKYAVVGTVLLLLKIMIEYCEFVDNIPSVTSGLLIRLVELIKMFNARTCQLVLGAGALQQVGLKTITTTNLALVFRCLQLIAHYIPKVKVHFEQRLSPKQQIMSKNFDQVLEDYKKHIQQISNKLQGITCEVLDHQLSKWEVKPPVPSPSFRAISKTLSKLHEAISDVLPEDSLRVLYRKINAHFKEKLKEQLEKRAVTIDGGPQHGVVTAELTFYSENMKALKNFPDGTLDEEFTKDIWVSR